MAAFLPYLLVAAGAGVGMNADKRAQQRQKRLIDAMEQFQTKKARGSGESIDKFLDTISPTSRAAESSQARGELQGELESSVGAAQAFENPQPIAGRVGSAYTERVASNEAAVKAKLERAMKELAIIGAPKEQSLRQGIRFGRAAGDVDAANSSIRNVGGAYEGAISRVRPSYGETFLSQLLMGLGTAGTGSVAGAAGGTLLGAQGTRRRQRGRPAGYGPNDLGSGLS